MMLSGRVSMKVFSACAACAFLVVSGAFAAQAAGPIYRAEFHHSYPLSSNGTFAINDVEGTIRIIGWEKNSAQLDAEKCAPTSDDLARLTISVDSKPDAVKVDTVFPPADQGWFSWTRLLGWSTYCNQRPEVNYVVHVPKHARVSLTSANADMTVVGPVGALRVDSASGDFSATDVGDATVDIQSGSVTFTRARGVLEVTTASGDVMFNDASGDVNVNSTSGEVQLYRVSGKAVVNTTSGDITARAFAGIARLSSTSGDVSMTLSRAANVALDASTISGEVSSDVPMHTKAPIVVRTTSGDITVHSI
jgi:hypothetical protein